VLHDSPSHGLADVCDVVLSLAHWPLVAYSIPFKQRYEFSEDELGKQESFYVPYVSSRHKRRVT